MRALIQSLPSPVWARHANGRLAFVNPAYAIAVGRSRTVDIGIGGLYFVAGSAPKEIRVNLLGSLAVQVIVAVVAASVRPFTSVAFAVLAPLWGLGLTGLWAARHGTFPERGRPGPSATNGHEGVRTAGDE